MTFEYSQRVVVEAELDIDNIGQCAILARTDLGEEYYLMIRSELGEVDIVEYGPAIPDMSKLPASVTYLYDHFEYSDYKLQKRIDKFLNNTKRGITQAQCVQVDEILPHIESAAHLLFTGEYMSVPRYSDEAPDDLEDFLEDEE